MATATAIEWAEVTWNPTTGCDRTSPGCDNCYALTLAKRLKAMGQPKYQRDGDARTSGPGFGVTLHEASIAEPFNWSRPRIVFVNSMSDLFHPQVSDEFIWQVFRTMSATPQHIYQILTKRPQRMADLLSKWCQELEHRAVEPRLPLRNVWLGTSIEDQRYAFRAEHLRRAPAGLRFLSLEPLLGPLPDLNLVGIDWVIVGGESGPKARQMKRAWVRDLRRQCRLAGVPFFFKQWGGRTPKAGGRELDGRHYNEMPLPITA